MKPTIKGHPVKCHFVECFEPATEATLMTFDENIPALVLVYCDKHHKEINKVLDESDPARN